MNLLYQKLKEIEKHPGMYLGEVSLSLLHAFINGYAMREMEVNKNFTNDYLHDFQKFISDKYKVTSCQSWSSIIRFYSTSELQAFEEFYRLLDEYSSGK